jgi:hypothetical protein
MNFGSRVQGFQFMRGWLHCCGSEARRNLMAGRW